MRIRVFLISIILFSSPGLMIAQKYLQLDKHGFQKEKLSLGDPIRFKLVSGPEIYVDEIGEISDSSVYLKKKEYPLPVNQIEIIFMRRSSVKTITQTSTYLAFWFLVAGAVEWAGDYGNYDATAAGILGAALLGIGQGVKVFRWKRYRITKNARLTVKEQI